MKNYSTHLISLKISVAVAFLVCIVMAIEPLISGNMPNFLIMLPTSVIVGIITYFILRKVLQKLVLEQIKPIYGTLESYSDSKVDVSKLGADGSENIAQIVSQVNDDVAQWAKDRAAEISILKTNEKYRKEFLGNVSHELKTPLFNIQGYIETLVDGGLKDDEINMTYLERADKNINRLISIVHDLETISKFESGMLKITMENFDITSVVREIFELYEMKAASKNITLRFVNEKQPSVIVWADKNRIFEVISNLVVNSINYGKEGGTTTVGIYDIENKYLIEVVDNGIGISEENIERVFERFFRVDKSRSSQSGGTGLGLAIVKHILEAHGERISVKSALGEGSTFSFTLEKQKS